MKPPKIEIEKMKLIESSYIDKEGYIYKATTLIEASKDLDVYETPLASIDIGIMPFAINNLNDFIFQIDRTNKTDLKYPIILDATGQIADGWHRVAKAILKGDRTIKTVRLDVMPENDGFQPKEA